jgi:hypothetical protein
MGRRKARKTDGSAKKEALLTKRQTFEYRHFMMAS